MDPNVVLAEIKKLVELHKNDARGDYALLLAHIEDLDEWLSNGGFLPEPWKK